MPVGIHRQLALADGAARVVRGDLVLAPRGHPLDGPAEPAGQPAEQHLFAVRAGLDAEAAADIGRDHPHPRLGQREEPRHLSPDPEGRLAGHPEGQLFGGLIEGGEDGARLHRHGREPLLDHAERDHARRARESACRVTLAQRAREGPVPLDLGEEPGRALGHRALGLGQRLEGLVRDVDQIERVPRGVDALRHHGGHGRPGGVDVPVGDDRMGRHAHVRHEPVDRHRRQMLHLGARHDGQDARGAARGLDVEAGDARVGVGRAEQRHVGAAGRADVVHVASGPDEQAMVLPSLERPADPGAVGGLFSVRHARLLSRLRGRLHVMKAGPVTPMGYITAAGRRNTDGSDRAHGRYGS